MPPSSNVQTLAPDAVAPSTRPADADGRRLIHFGCGSSARRTCWTDYDGSWQAKLLRYPWWLRWAPKALYSGLVKRPADWPEHIRYMELRKPLTLATGSVDAVYASHLLEHLYRDEAVRFVAECHRVLKPGGVLRLAVPNLRYYAERYLASTDPGAGDVLMRDLLLREEAPVRNPLLRLYHLFGGNFHEHKWMYEPASLAEVLRSAGFTGVGERACRDSGIPEIAFVESPERVSPSAGFAVEGVKAG